MQKHIKQNRRIYLFVALIAILSFSTVIIGNHGYLLYFGDSFEINYKLWVGGYEAVHNGTLGQFAPSLGLGMNSFAYIFYFLSNPFFWLATLLPKSFLIYSFLVFHIVIMGGCFYISDLWLYKTSKHRYGSLIGALLITFSAYSFFYLQAEQLETLFLLYPLCLYYTECFIQDRKWIGVVSAVALTGITNYYLLFLLLPFLSIYTIIRYLLVHHDETLQTILKRAMQYAGCITLGIALCSFILLPCAYLVTSMPRFQTTDVSITNTLQPIQWYRILSSLFLPAFEKLDATPIIQASKVPSYGWSGGCPLYTSILTPVLLFLSFFVKDKKEKKANLTFACILLIFLAFPYFSFKFQMSIDTRYYYMYVFFNAYLASFVIKDFETNTNLQKHLNKATLLTILIPLLFLLLAIVKHFNTRRQLAAVGIVLLISFAFLLLFTKQLRKKQFQKLFYTLCIEAIFIGLVFGFANEPIVYWALEDPILSINVGNDIDKYDSREHFYRVSYGNKTILVNEDPSKEEGGDTLTYMSGNEPFANSYRGFAFYESLYNMHTEDFINRMKSTWNMTQMTGRNRTYNMLSSKYFYQYADDIPVPYGYKKVEDVDFPFDLYENENFVELGYAYENTINANYLKSLPFFVQDQIMVNYLAIEDAINESYELDDSIQPLTILPATDERYYTFEEPIQNVTLFIENYGLPNLKIRTYYKGEEVHSYNIWQFNYIDFPVYEPIDEIHIIGKNLYGPKQTELPMYIEPFDSNYYTNSFKDATKEHFENVICSNDQIQANITIHDHTKYVMTSLPYDEGWSVLVDGKTIPYEKVQLGFIGFQLEPGTHEVEFTYHIPYLKEGIIASIASMVIYGILIAISKRKTRAN